MTVKLMYEDEEIGHVMTNHSMSIEDVLAQLDINMDDYAREHGWDGWDYEALRLEFCD